MTHDPIPVLDHGDVTLIDSMGDDSAIVPVAMEAFRDYERGEVE